MDIVIGWVALVVVLVILFWPFITGAWNFFAILHAGKQLTQRPEATYGTLPERRETCYMCGCTFSQVNPDFGGGVCSDCWAKSH